MASPRLQNKEEDAEEFDEDEGLDRDQVVSLKNPHNLPPAVTASGHTPPPPPPPLPSSFPATLLVRDYTLTFVG